MKVKAYAKINLTLDVTGRRPDGYHTLDTIMQSVSVWDEVEIKKTSKPGIRVFCNREYLPVDTKNTAFRAAQYFFEHCGITGQGLAINIRKYVPSRAGMGGGSADVAAVLRCLRTLYAPELPRSALEEIGLAVGSDVPFCVHGGTCLAEGRGEVLTDLPPLPACAIVLCKPDFGLPTPELFTRVDGADLGKRPDASAMAEALARGELAAVTGCLGNVFERVLTGEEGADIRAIQAALLDCGALGAAMSGSGPTVFGLFDREDLAREAWEGLRALYRDTFLTRTSGEGM